MRTSDIKVMSVVADVLEAELGITHAQACVNQIRHKYYKEELYVPNPDTLVRAIQSNRTCIDNRPTKDVGWWNWLDSDLLLVSANLDRDQRYSSQLGQLFKQANFSSAFVGCISAAKCNAEELHGCERYVYDQVDISRPMAIAVTGKDAFSLFQTNQKNYTSSIGTSWWWGLYKIYCLPLLKDIEDGQWSAILSEIHNFVYGTTYDTIDIRS